MNKANHVISSCNLLLEGIFDTSAYFNCELPIEQHFQEERNRRQIHSNPDIFNITFDKNILNTYKKNLKKVAYSPAWNYIYHLNQRLDTYKLTNEKDIAYLIKKGILLDCAKDRLPNFDSMVARSFNWDKINELGLLGIQSNRGKLEILVNNDKLNPFLAGLTIIDGNAKRFETGSDKSKLIIPDDILHELVLYTTNAQNTFSEEATHWLKSHIKKPYKEITLYRAFGITMDDIWDEREYQKNKDNPEFDYYIDEDEEENPDYENSDEYEEGITIYHLMDIFQHYMGVSEPSELHKGTKVNITRYKESSWSTKPQISSSFSSDNFRDFNVMVKATVPASKVVVDFNLLPKSLLKEKFRYWTQNEVVLDNTSIPAVITNVSLSEEAKNWLIDQDYEFSPNKGITEYSF